MAAIDPGVVAESEYGEFLRFTSRYKTLSQKKLDSSFVEEFKLFNVPTHEGFNKIERKLDKIISTLGAMKRIFSKPIVHLKDVYEVMPTESVRVINNYTISHATLHSELWTRTRGGGLKPEKLMTIDKAETYTIYENIMFAKAVDTVLAFVKKTSVLLKDILYGFRELNFNLLDSTQHSSYFLAIGKLRKGYSGADNQKINSYNSCVRKLLLIEQTLRSKLSSSVYAKCRGRAKNLTLKKTNIFRSHKDYRAIYELLKFFDSDLDTAKELNTGIQESGKGYAAYCTLLSLFSILHFNFTFAESGAINFEKLNERFSFSGWSLTLRGTEVNGTRALLFDFHKESDYTVCVFISDRSDLTEAAIDGLKSCLSANEYLFATSSSYGVRDTLYLSIYDIDSFRRVQQMILRGMIITDRAQKMCPYCGGKTEKTENGYICEACRGKVSARSCEVTGKPYLVSEILKHRSSLESSRAYEEKSKFLHDRCAEAQLHFRNITEITADGAPVCPHCGKVHYN